MSKQSQRKAYGETLVELGHENEKIVVLEADLGKSTMSILFQQEFPERYFEMGIAEQNMTSFAAGLALSGKIAFTNSFAVFSTGRSYDQIRQSICTAKLNVKINGSSAGLSDFGDGATHQAIEDISIMRSLPNMSVFVPMDATEARKIVRAAVEHDGPVYIRISRSDLEDHFPEDGEFKVGKPYVLREGTDIVMFACGIMVSKALSAAQILEKEGISVKVVNVSSLKPLDESAIRNLAKGVKGIITAEEHSVIGGLTSAITYILRGQGTPIEPVAVMDTFGQSGFNHDELLEYYGLTDTAIVDTVQRILKQQVDDLKIMEDNKL
ncbi:transketolase family protein [Sunxiuqinia sp. A32]|uniref:transketolase family protein n=1 Tax=Sunxiuqinia sp. A32 TaxID=3461496 RepID=UPI0040457465